MQQCGSLTPEQTANVIKCHLLVDIVVFVISCSKSSKAVAQNTQITYIQYIPIYNVCMRDWGRLVLPGASWEFTAWQPEVVLKTNP